nr:hypothetical protein BaRGS_013631 [Batillaria attramentaria]
MIRRMKKRVVNVTLNGTAIFVFWFLWRTRNTFTAITEWVLWSDMVDCLVLIPGQIAEVMLEYHHWSDLSCKVYHFIDEFSITLSSCFLIMHAIDRYMRCIHPWKITHTQTAKLQAFAAMILAGIIASPTSLVFRTVKTDGRDEKCDVDLMSGSVEVTMFLTSRWVVFVVTTTVLCWLYTLTIIKTTTAAEEPEESVMSLETLTRYYTSKRELSAKDWESSLEGMPLPAIRFLKDSDETIQQAKPHSDVDAVGGRNAEKTLTETANGETAHDSDDTSDKVQGKTPPASSVSGSGGASKPSAATNIPTQTLGTEEDDVLPRALAQEPSAPPDVRHIVNGCEGLPASLQPVWDLRNRYSLKTVDFRRPHQALGDRPPVQYSPAEKIPQTDRRIHWYFYTEEPSESEESDSSSSWHYDSQKLWWSASLLQESRGIMSRNRTLLASCMVLAGYVVSHLPAIATCSWEYMNKT